MAHLYSAQANDLLGNLSAVRQEMALALAGFDRVSERERYLIQAIHSEYEGDYVKAASQYRLLTNLYPHDLNAWKGLGDAANYAGLPDQAIEAERHVLQISPDNGSAYSSLIMLLVTNGKPTDALDLYRAAVHRGIDNTGLHRGAGIAFMVQGDLDSAGKQFALCGRSGDLYGQNLSSLYLAGLHLYQGKLAQAIPELRAGFVLDIKQGSSGWTPLRRLLLGEALLAQGNTAAAQSDARDLAAIANHLNQAEFHAFAGILALRTGQRGLAQAALRSLEQLRAQRPNASFDSAAYKYLLGASQLADGHASEALDSELSGFAYYAIPGILRVEGDAYSALHQWDKAAAAYRDYLGHAGDIFNYYSPLDWALAHLDLARVLARAGHREEAAAAYEKFLELWVAADPGLPALRQARAEKNALASSAGSAHPPFKQARTAPSNSVGGEHGKGKSEGSPARENQGALRQDVPREVVSGQLEEYQP
jgi:tetratricopeptide (TPR) repeat protein